jgi:hypothetical protein
MRTRVSRYLPWLSPPMLQAGPEGPPRVRRQRARQRLQGWLVPRSRRPRLNSRKKRRERVRAERAAAAMRLSRLAQGLLAGGLLETPAGGGAL